MKSVFILFVALVPFIFPATTISQEFGAVRFLLNYVPPTGGGYTAGCWGWTDTATGREYALLGNRCGTAVVEITQTSAPVERSFIPGPCSSWREIQVHGHYAYVVTEAGGGTQIIDLSTLPDSARLVKNFLYSSGGKSNSRGHTVHIRDGYMYLNGCATWSPGGILVFDLADPENPSYQGEYAGAYIHDCFVRNDTIYGAAIYGEGIKVIDATDKTSPAELRTINYPGSGTHNTATTTDGRYVLSTDEIGSTPKTLKIWDLATDSMVAYYAGSATAIVHNVFVKDSLAIMSYYTAGIRVVDISDPAAPLQLGGYDTRPADESSSYTGAWSVYPFFPSGKIVIGDMGGGMFVVDMNVGAPRAPGAFTAYSDFSTPGSAELAWTDVPFTVAGDTVTDLEFRLYRNGVFIATVPAGTGSYTDTGLTLHGEYEYLLLAVGSGDSSAPVGSTIFAGGAASAGAPTGLSTADLMEGVRLTWTNPATQTDGTPLNDLAAVEIFRDGIQVADIPAGPADTGMSAAYTDTVTGYHSYRIRVRDNEVPPNTSAFTDSVEGYGGLLETYSEDFESGVENLFPTGTWDTTSALAHGGAVSYTDSPGDEYLDNTNFSFVTPRVIIHTGDTLSFWHILITLTADIGWVEASRDRGTTWSVLKGYNSVLHTEWADGSADPGDWFMERISLAPFAGDTVSFRFRLQTNVSGTADGWYVDDINTSPVTAADGGPGGGVPGRFALHQNSPNPFNPTTQIRFDLPVRASVRLSVYNALGQEIRTLIEEESGPGSRTVTWDGRSSTGATVPSGAYFYAITAEGADGSRFADRRGMMLIK